MTDSFANATTEKMAGGTKSRSLDVIVMIIRNLAGTVFAKVTANIPEAKGSWCS